MPQTLYYVKMDADVYGPYGVDSVRGFHLLPDIEVLSDQTNEWRQAREYPELRDALDLSLEQAYPAPRTEAAPTPVTSFDQNTEFYIRRGASSYGPYSLTDLVGLRLPDETALSLDGMNTWVWLRDVPGLSTTLSYIAAHPAPPEISEPSEPSELSEPSEFSEDSDRAPVDPAIIRADLARSLGKIKALKEVYNLNFRRVFPTKEARQEFLIKEYDSIFSRLPEELEDLLQIARILSLNPAAEETVVRTVNETVADINAHYENEFKRLDIDRTVFSSAVVRQGKTHFSLPSPLEGVSFERMENIAEVVQKYLTVPVRPGVPAPEIPEAPTDMDCTGRSETLERKAEEFRLASERVRELAEDRDRGDRELCRPDGVAVCPNCHLPIVACRCPRDPRENYVMFHYNLDRSR